jgi:hypothetical protein
VEQSERGRTNPRPGVKLRPGRRTSRSGPSSSETLSPTNPYGRLEPFLRVSLRNRFEAFAGPGEADKSAAARRTRPASRSAPRTRWGRVSRCSVSDPQPPERAIAGRLVGRPDPQTLPLAPRVKLLGSFRAFAPATEGTVRRGTQPIRNASSISASPTNPKARSSLMRPL